MKDSTWNGGVLIGAGVVLGLALGSTVALSIYSVPVWSSQNAPAWVQAIGSVAAVLIAIVVSIWQQWNTRKIAQVDAYMKFSERWESPEIRHHRYQLARLLLDKTLINTSIRNITKEEHIGIYRGRIERVIDFYEELGLALKLGVAHRDMVENWYCDSAIAYWNAVGKNHCDILNADRDDAPYYANFRYLVEEMIKIDRLAASKDSIIDLLRDEVALNS